MQRAKSSGNIKGVMICVFVDVKRSEDIIGMMRLNWRIRGDKMRTIDGDEVCSTINDIDVDYGNVPLIMCIEAWPCSPHPGIGVCLIRTEKLMYYSTQIVPTVHCKGKNPHYIQTSHSWNIWIDGNKCTIISGMFLHPRQACANELVVHAIDATDVTGHIETGCGRIKN